ncbi:XdhC family protein [Denitrobaculum tricleocarpae]|uniref:XdhC family protein n=1 Tax=Denitrobaculum tricleocarpae TaxID=2591009 RepID=UPI0015D217AF|nr:XdhC family protein [Denitrobaculum tricleocarpae]
MQSETLAQIQSDRDRKTPVVRALDLESGNEHLIRPFDDDSGSSLLQAAQNAALADKSQVIEIDGKRIFLQVFNPPLRMIVVGAVHISQALVPMAQIAGYDVTVVDPRRAFGSDIRFPGVTLSNDWPDVAVTALKPDRRTAIVTLTHDPKIDDPALNAALTSTAFYIGSLGSRKTHAARLARLSKAGFDETAQARIDGPIGLAIGAKSPAEIAISIMAKITQTLRQAPTGDAPTTGVKETAAHTTPAVSAGA